MTKDQDLAKLENIVENLLLRFNVLKQDKSELEAQLKAKEDKISELQTLINSMNENNSEVQGRVSSLIGSIEDWEKTVLADDQDMPGATKVSSKKKSGTEEQGESQLFSVGE